MPDYDDPNVYAQNYAMASTPLALKHIPLRAQLTHELKQHEREIERITQLLNLMDSNPAIEQFINLQRGYTL